MKAPAHDQEVALHGGRLTPGVVRIGDTVRRPPTASSAFVGRLLQHVHERGFYHAPEYFGRDEQGREMFRYISGDVPAKFRRFDDGQIRAAAKLLRKFHDATRGSELAGNYSVVCHNDAGPNNMIFQRSLPVALIDFDLAAPGEPLSDLGYMAWAWCVSSKTERQPVSGQALQVRCLLDAYGIRHEERAGFVDIIIERQSRNIEFWTERRRTAVCCPTETAKIDEMIEWSRRERKFTEFHRLKFLASLT